MNLDPAPAVPVRIVIVDADRRVRDSLCDLIRCEPGLEAVAAVGHPAAAIAVIEQASPDIVVIDPRLPEVDAGRGLIADVRARWPTTQILVMGWSETLENGALATGTDGLLDKTASPDDLLAVIVAAATRGGRA